MPYITQLGRQLFADKINELYPTSSGELNYCITKLVHNYLLDLGNESYNNYNEVIGVLECVKQEFYKQVVAKYEAKKRSENGAVSKLDSRTLEDVR